MDLVQSIQNTYVLNDMYFSKSHAKFKLITDKYTLITDNDLQVVDDLYNVIKNSKSKIYKYDHPRSIINHSMFHIFCQRFQYISMVVLLKTLAKGLPNNLKCVANYLKIMMCDIYSPQLFNYILVLLKKYDYFMKDLVFKDIFLYKYMSTCSNSTKVIKFLNKFKLNIDTHYFYMPIHIFIDLKKQIKPVIECYDFYDIYDSDCVVFIANEPDLLNYDKTMRHYSIIATTHNNYNYDIEAIFKSFIHHNQQKNLGQFLQEVIKTKLDITSHVCK
jgi:hypothetical protein